MRASARERSEQQEGGEEGRQCDDGKCKDEGGEARGEEGRRQGVPDGSDGK